MDKRWIKTYDELAKKHKNPIAQSGYMIEGNPLPEQMFDNWINYIQQKFCVEEKNYLLDVGCGSGIFLSRFKKYTLNLYGVDTSPNQVEAAMHNCAEAKLRVGDALDAEFGELKFDRIICNSVFLYFSSTDYAKKVIEYFVKISSSNARLWIGDLSFPTEDMDPLTCRRKTRTDGQEMQLYKVEFMENLCHELGLKGTFVKQQVEGKLVDKYLPRYDFLIEK